MPEALVILDPTVAGETRAAIARIAGSIQSVSSRVLLVTASADAIGKLRSASGVAKVLTGGESAADLPTLDDAESLFAAAWLSRTGTPKQRPGDGLDWDTPPMIPPDAKEKP